MRAGVILSAMLLVCVLSGCAMPPNLNRLNSDAPAGHGFVMHETDASSDGARHRYSVFIPYDYAPDRPQPAIMFLHGLGEGGGDGRKPLTMGLAQQIRHDPASFDFLVIFPQTHGDWKRDASHDLAMAVLEDAMRRYTIDPARIVLTGISTGGQGVWLIGARHGHRFAALVPIAAWAADGVVEQLTDIPIWAFHSRFDAIVPSSQTARMIRKIEQAGGNARYTGYRSLSHFAWERAYSDPDLMNWMRQQKHPGAQPAISE